MEYSRIRYDVADRVATVTLARPHKLNAFNIGMWRELLDVFDRIDADDEVRAVIVTGDGRAFCAGADLSAGTKTFDGDEPGSFGSGDGPANAAGANGVASVHRDEGGVLTLRIFECRKPVIAAVNGAAVGVGVTMTLPMDIRLASDDARFGFVFPRRGIVTEAASSWFLPRVVGMSRALEWTMTGRIFGAEEALAGGLVRSVHAPDDLLPAATELATEIAANTSALSVMLNRHMIWRMAGAAHPMEAHKLDSRGMAFMGRSADAREGVVSFLEKRSPVFGMRPSVDVPEWFPLPVPPFA